MQSPCLLCLVFPILQKGKLRKAPWSHMIKIREEEKREVIEKLKLGVCARRVRRSNLETPFPHPPQPQGCPCWSASFTIVDSLDPSQLSPGANQPDIGLSGSERERIHFTYSTFTIEIAPTMSLCLLSYFSAKVSQKMVIISFFFPPSRWIIDFHACYLQLQVIPKWAGYQKCAEGESFDSALGGWGGTNWSLFIYMVMGCDFASLLMGS